MNPTEPLDIERIKAYCGKATRGEFLSRALTDLPAAIAEIERLRQLSDDLAAALTAYTKYNGTFYNAADLLRRHEALRNEQGCK